jgi:hypothetical protein
MKHAIDWYKLLEQSWERVQNTEQEKFWELTHCDQVTPELQEYWDNAVTIALHLHCSRLEFTCGLYYTGDIANPELFKEFMRMSIVPMIEEGIYDIDWSQSAYCKQMYDELKMEE